MAKVLTYGLKNWSIFRCINNYYLTLFHQESGVATRLECLLSHLGVAGSSPGHDSFWKPLGIVYDRWKKNRQKSVTFSRPISDRSSMVLVKPSHTKDMYLRECRAQRHTAKAWLQAHGKSSDLSEWLRRKAPRTYFSFTLTLFQLLKPNR